MDRKTILFSLIILLQLLILPAFVLAVGSSCLVTIPKALTFQDGWFGDPESSSSSEEIAPGGEVDLYADSGGFGCPPYTWSVSGTGYSLDKAETKSDFEVVTLNSEGGT